MPRRQRPRGVILAGAGITLPAPDAGARAGGMPSTQPLAPCTGPQTLILDHFPSVADVKLLGPNSGTANRYALGRARKAVHGRVYVAVLRQGIRYVPPPVVVTLRYVFPDDIHRDADNFAAIGKSVIDGLVKSQILAGDNAARLSQRVEFVKERGARRLEVVLEHVEV